MLRMLPNQKETKNKLNKRNLPCNFKVQAEFVRPFVAAPVKCKPAKKRRIGTVNDVPEKKLQRNDKRNPKKLT